MIFMELYQANKRILIWALISTFMSITLLALVFWPSGRGANATANNDPNQTNVANIANNQLITNNSPAQTQADSSAIPILMYHHVKEPKDPAGDKIDYNLSVPTSVFSQQMASLSLRGYGTVSTKELFSTDQSNKIILTFDDGYKDVITNAFPVMQNYGFKGTVFVIVGSIGKDDYMTLEDLKTLRDAGWEIGSHTLSHPDLAKASPEKAQREITESKARLEADLGITIDTICYPSGRYSPEVLTTVQDSGYHFAVTTKPGRSNLRSDAYTLKRVRINGPDSLNQFTSKVFPK